MSGNVLGDRGRYPCLYLTPKLPRGLFHLTEPGVHMISHVPHSTQSSYWNCMTPLARLKHPAGQPYMHMKCGGLALGLMISPPRSPSYRGEKTRAMRLL